MTSLLEQINGYLLGGQPIKRENCKAGQTQYYYINPGQEYVTTSNLQTTDIPDKYDHRDNLMATLHNFEIINKEHPIEKPVSTGNAVLDNYILKRIAVTSPLTAASISAVNYGYQGGRIL